MRNRINIIRALTDAFLIRRSGLFHIACYWPQVYQVPRTDRYLLKLSPVLHYVFIGVFEGKNPNPLFDTEYYLDKYPDVIVSGQNPLAHFIRHGAQNRYDPGPFFDTGYYLDQGPSIAAAGLNPLLHYFRYGRHDGRDPNQLVTTVHCVQQPSAADWTEGRNWLQQGLGAPSVSGPRPARRPHRMIRFEWDLGGLNNIRMQVEVLVCLAARYDRVLVLPTPGQWYLIPGGNSHLFDYFDEAAFRAAVPVLPPDTRIDDEWEVPAHLGATNTVRLVKEKYLWQQDRESWFFPRTTRMFGSVASVLGSDTDHYALIHRAFRIRGDLLDQATQLLAIHGLKPGGYLAVHVRRGDFHLYKDIRYLSVAKVVEALYRHGADSVGSLLIVSDEYDQELLDACRGRGWNPVCWATKHSGEARLEGILDMLSCCLGWRFVGTPLSTFSAGIIQWRGYMSRVAGSPVDAIPRFTTELDQVPWWAAVDEHAWLSI